MAPATIRQAGAEDAEVLARLLRELQGGGALVAEVEGAPVGCVFFHPREDHLYVDRLAVLPSHRGEGSTCLLYTSDAADEL